MPFYAPASNLKTGNGEDLYIPVSDISDTGPVDVINGNLLVTGTLTSGDGNVVSGDASNNESSFRLVAGGKSTQSVFRPSIPDILTIVDGTNSLSVGKTLVNSFVPLTVGGIITGNEVRALSGSNFSQLQENSVYFSNGSVGLQVNSNTNTITVQRSSTSDPANMVVSGNLTVTGTLVANIPNATSYLMPLSASPGGSLLTSINSSGAGGTGTWTIPANYSAAWLRCPLSAIFSGLVQFRVLGGGLNATAGVSIRQFNSAGGAVLSSSFWNLTANEFNIIFKMNDPSITTDFLYILVGVDQAVQQ
jgi:hypothetical protein